MSLASIKRLFLVAAIYDGVLALGFLVAAPMLFERFGVTPPNHPGYVAFPALMLLVFTAMFLRIARDPVQYRHMMPYAMGVKVAYAGTAFWYQLQNNIPSFWIPLAWIDVVFLVLFVLAWRATAGPARPVATHPA